MAEVIHPETLDHIRAYVRAILYDLEAGLMGEAIKDTDNLFFVMWGGKALEFFPYVFEGILRAAPARALKRYCDSADRLFDRRRKEFSYDPSVVLALTEAEDVKAEVTGFRPRVPPEKMAQIRERADKIVRGIIEEVVKKGE